MFVRDTPLRYCAYLLRCWQEPGSGPGPLVWRFSLEDPHTGERRGFATWERLLAFLQAELRDEPCGWPGDAPAGEDAG